MKSIVKQDNSAIRTIVAIVACTASLICSGAVSAESIYERIDNGEPIRYGMANDPPYAYIEADGSRVGIEYDLLRSIFNEMGIGELELVVTKFGSLIPGLKADRFDVASDGIYVRPSRCEQVLFSQPVLINGVGAIVKTSADFKPQSEVELAQEEGIRIGHTSGGSEHKGFLAAGGNADQVIDFPDHATLLAAVKSGRIDVGLLTALGSVGAVRSANDTSLEVISPLKPVEINGEPLTNYASFAFSKSDSEFVEAFNELVKDKLVSDEYREIVERYGFSADIIPSPDIDLESLCTEETS